MNKRKLGSEKEDMAIKYLQEHGYKILKRNFFSYAGEIDIIGENEGYLCFIEVKYRSSAENGFPSEAVNYSKIKKISLASRAYLNYAGIGENYPCRFDVISILGNEYELIKNAFEAAF